MKCHMSKSCHHDHFFRICESKSGFYSSFGGKPGIIGHPPSFGCERKTTNKVIMRRFDDTDIDLIRRRCREALKKYFYDKDN